MRSRKSRRASLIEAIEPRRLLSTIYVDANATGATHDGASWNSAYQDLQQALSAAVSGDEIRVADGTYKPTSGTDRTISFALKSGVSIFGAYAGYGAPYPDVRNLAAYRTVLSGDIGTAGNNSDNSYHVVSAAGVGSSTAINGLTVTLGNANGGVNHNIGAGILAVGGSSMAFANCTFILNTAATYGGGIYNDESSPEFINCVFSANTGTFSGGGMYNHSSSPTLINCSFGGNIASTGGGGIVNFYYSYPTLVNCIVWDSGRNPVNNDNVSRATASTSTIQGGYSGDGNISVDPRFVRSPWTGPDGVFGTTDDDYGDLRLRNDSICLDAGSNPSVPDGVSTDVTGNLRIQNGTVDMGAYEGAFAAPLAKVIYVDSSSVGANSGSSWSDAYSSLQSAFLAARDGDTIRVADGTYTPTSGTDRATSFAIKSGVSLYGGYAGWGAKNPNTRDNLVYITSLSGDIGATADTSDNSYHVLISKGIANVVVDGLTIELGNSTGSDANTDRGAGFYCVSSSSIAFNDCVLSSNKTGTGGGVYAKNSSLTLTSCVVTRNVAAFGGGMYTVYSLQTSINCVFSENQASNKGGGLYNEVGEPVFTNCIFTSNTASSSGGAIYNYLSSPILNNCTISNNSAREFGGGVCNRTSSAPALTRCTIVGNTTLGSGGGIYDDQSAPLLFGCILSGNIAGVFGGAMANEYYSSSRLVNCSIIGNSAPTRSSGMYNHYYSSPTLTNCTFSENTVSGSGSPIYNIDESSPILRNCIIWGSGNRPIANLSNSIPTITYSNLQGGYAGTGNINVDPLFVRNPSPGADGKWGGADDDYGDLRLQANSSCIDAGSNAAVPTGVTTDLAGNPRIVDMPGVRDYGERVDMGAYEYLPALTYQSDAAKPTLRMSFAFDVNPTTLSASDLVLLNLTSGQPLSTSGAVVNYDSNTRIATWQFSGALPDGDYRATLPAGSVSDTSGTPLASDSLCNFFTLGGDANRDRLVDIKDLYILSSNWSGDNKLFSQGDFNYDGKVDANDLAILSARWQQNLAPPVAAAPVSIAKVVKRSPVRMVSVVG